MTSNEDRAKFSPGKHDDSEGLLKRWLAKNEDSRTYQNEYPWTSSWLNQNRRLLGDPFGQSKPIQSAMVVCFVCGQFMRDENKHKLSSRNSHIASDAPFFPFLEYHDPAPGAEPMKDDWSVLACLVCSSLLAQQWKSFERAKMPINKRLYWLKRPSGCEIRQPVSQIELEDILNAHAKENYTEQDESESDEDPEEQRTSKKRARVDSPQPPISKEDRNIETPSKSPSPPTDQTPSARVTPFVCYSCGKKDTLLCSVFPIHCKPSYEQMRAGVPYYPTVLHEKGAPDSTVLYESVTFLCMACLPKYKIHWHYMQQSFLDRDVTKMALPRIPLPEQVSCYLCGACVSTKFNDGILHTTTDAGKKNSYFERLRARKQLNGSCSLALGFTYLCPVCRPLIANNEDEHDVSASAGDQEDRGVEKRH